MLYSKVTFWVRVKQIFILAQLCANLVAVQHRTFFCSMSSILIFLRLGCWSCYIEENTTLRARMGTQLQPLGIAPYTSNRHEKYFKALCQWSLRWRKMDIVSLTGSNKWENLVCPDSPGLSEDRSRKKKRLKASRFRWAKCSHNRQSETSLWCNYASSATICNFSMM